MAVSPDRVDQTERIPTVAIKLARKLEELELGGTRINGVTYAITK